MIDTKKCILPWIHLNIEQNGNVVPCCESDIGTPLGNVNESDIQTIWNNDKYKKLRSDMLNDIEPEQCKNCYDSERNLNDKGYYSKRQRENKKWSRYWDRTNNIEPEFKINYIDLRYSNVCNYKCRYCFPLASHGIASELKITPVILKFDQTAVDTIINNNIEHLEEIYFVGGEPMVMEEHYDLLDRLIKIGNTKTKLRYSTNLSKLEFKGKSVLDYWKHFDNIEVLASIDHYGEKLEYMRHGSIWSETLTNLKTVKGLSNVTLKIACLVTIYNLMDIPDIFYTFYKENIIDKDTFILSPLRDPEQYSITSLPMDQKIIARNNLIKFLDEASDNMSHNIKMLLTYIVDTILENDTYKENKVIFIKDTSKLDTLRNENFGKTFPELKNYYECTT